MQVVRVAGVEFGLDKGDEDSFGEVSGTGRHSGIAVVYK